MSTGVSTDREPAWSRRYPDLLPRLAQTLLDSIYPSRCALCDVLGSEPICQVCQSSFAEFPLDPASMPGEDPLDYRIAIYRYHERVAQAVTRLKYERATSLAGPMARAIAEVAEQRNLLSNAIIVPVPIHWSRLCTRGFNQSLLLSEALPRPTVRPSLLRRVRATRPQAGLSREERLRNLENAFEASSEVEGCEILLLDDVFTTGRTASECARALKRKGAIQVGILAFAGGGL